MAPFYGSPHMIDPRFYKRSAPDGPGAFRLRATSRQRRQLVWGLAPDRQSRARDTRFTSQKGRPRSPARPRAALPARRRTSAPNAQALLPATRRDQFRRRLASNRTPAAFTSAEVIDPSSPLGKPCPYRPVSSLCPASRSSQAQSLAPTLLSWPASSKNRPAHADAAAVPLASPLSATTFHPLRAL